MKYSKRNKIALFLLATVLFMQSVLFPITTYASKNTAEDAQRAAQEAAAANEAQNAVAEGAITAGAAVTGAGVEATIGTENYQYVPGELEWAGTEKRCALLLYIVNCETGTINRPSDYVILIDTQYEKDTDGIDWKRKLTHVDIDTRFGKLSDSEWTGKFRSANKYGDVPQFAAFSSDEVTGDDSVTGSTVNVIKSWLEESSGQTYKGIEICRAYHIINQEFTKFGYKIDDFLPQSNGDKPKYVLCFETVSAIIPYVVFETPFQGEVVAAQRTKRTPAVPIYTIDENGNHVRDERIHMLGTARTLAIYFTSTRVDITRRHGTFACGNHKWIQSLAKSYGITENYNEKYGWSLEKIKPISQELVDKEINVGEIQTYGFATGVVDPMKIPLGTCNDSTPGNTEEITEFTKGNKIIYKGYYTRKIHSDGTSDIEDVKVFKRGGTTNWILLEAEDKNGYTMRCWKPSNSLFV